MTKSLDIVLTGILLELLLQLELADESQISSDFAIALMENVGGALQDLDGLELAKFMSIVQGVASAENIDYRKKYISDFF